MAEPRNDAILNYLRQILGGPASGVGDAELLRRFLNGRDEAAFELLLWRHAGLVLHVCRQVLSDADAVEDAFQATFLVLIRKAGSISKRESLGGWLHRVAYHIALKLRKKLVRRSGAEQTLDEVTPLAAPAEADDPERRELRRMICEEVNRLPPKYRAPIVACYFEAKTHEEAAHQLGWPQGTVASRLARGRDLLYRRLVRRGVTLSASAVVAALSVRTSQATLARMITTTMKMLAAGRSVGSLVPPSIAALAEGVLRTMFWTRMKIVTAVVLLAMLGGVGPILWNTPSITAEQSATARGTEAKRSEDPAQIARNMAISRLNLKRLASAMHQYAEANQHRLPPPATQGKDGKMLLSWRVLLLPYLGERELYEKFKLSEAWDSPHNKKLLPRMPDVYAAPGVKLRQPFYTYYQVFVSPKPRDNPGEVAIQAAFVEKQPQIFPAHFWDGTSNTILIIEGGKAVPWTKPEDLDFARDQPLPKLGGVSPDLIHAAFADGSVHMLTKDYDEVHLRGAITSNGGEVIAYEKIESSLQRVFGALDREPQEVEDWKRKNEELRRRLETMRAHVQMQREELDVLRERSGAKRQPATDPRLELLKQENDRLEAEEKKIREEMAELYKEFRKLQEAAKKKTP
jgi:RNA polymerase sigma factor (sigma-70 family)